MNRTTYRLATRQKSIGNQAASLNNTSSNRDPFLPTRNLYHYCYTQVYRQHLGHVVLECLEVSRREVRVRVVFIGQSFQDLLPAMQQQETKTARQSKEGGRMRAREADLLYS